MEYFAQEIQLPQYYKEEVIDFSLALLVVAIPALIFTIQGWQKNDRKEIKTALPLYFLQALISSAYVVVSTVFYHGEPIVTIINLIIPFFILLGGGPAIFCAIALVRTKKNSRHIEI
jgi:hypothetical protein